MTTVANEEGQSVLEFLVMLPVLVGLVMLMVKVNSAIQMSIVNQQYARAEATWLTFNSPVFPDLVTRSAQLDAKGYNQMMIGVADNTVNDPDAPFNPQASVQNVARNRTLAQQGNMDNQHVPTLSEGRGFVRIRDTVSLCSQVEVLNIGGSFQPILDLNGGGTNLPGNYNLPEGPGLKFPYCRSIIDE